MTPPRARRSALLLSALALDTLPEALASGADLVCIDLEAPVPAELKEEAREGMVTRLAGMSIPDSVQLVVRVNEVGSPQGDADLRAVLMRVPSVSALLLPMVDGGEAVRLVSRIAAWARPAADIYAIVETARGLEDCAAIARADPRLKALFFGGFDMSAALGCEMAWEPLLYARSRVVHAGALAGLQVIDSPYPDVDDLPGLRANCERLKALGMTGKATKSVKQVATINQAFAK